MQQGIVAEKLSAGYGDTPVFQNLNLKILPGKITTLIGTNGSGKSTILKTLSRLLTPAEGTVCLDGDSIFRMSTRAVAQRLAVLPQGAQAPSGITVKDLVEYGRYPYRKRLSGLTSKDEEIIKWALDSTICWIWLAGKWTNFPAGRDSERGSQWLWHRKQESFFWMNLRHTWTFLINWKSCNCSNN